jgi:hypothetical protein
MRKVAVLTDVVDPEFFFPLWHSYYGKQFGEENLFVVTYANSRPIRPHFRLGGLIHLPAIYNDVLRAKFISNLNTTLLDLYDVVLRVDADELLVADPRKYQNLSDYVNSVKALHVTALGLDIIQGATEGPLNLALPVLGSQRRFAYPNASLNKTCLTSTPTTWLSGFHFCNHYPNFDELFLLHLKRADINQQIQWAGEMLRATPNDPHLSQYYATDENPIRKYRNDVLAREIYWGWDGIPRDAYLKRVLKSYSLIKVENKLMYSGKHFHDDILVELPNEFTDIF